MGDNPDINDRIGLRAVGALLSRNPVVACCPADGEPLIFTLEYAGAEFVCAACDQKFGYLAPEPKAETPELLARLKILRAQYGRARAHSLT